MDRKIILIVGAGDLCLQILQLLASGNMFHIYVASRNLEKTTRMCNLVRLIALQCGVSCSITPVEIELGDVYRTADFLVRIRPDVVLNCASLFSARTLGELPASSAEELGQIQRGPWLPLHLAPAYDFMRAVRLSGVRTVTINAAFPDAVNTVLDKAGLAPVIGVGNLADRIPALRMAIARLASCTAEQVSVKLIGKHQFSHSLPQSPTPVYGLDATKSCYKLSYRIRDVDCTGRYPDAEIFCSARMDYRHLGEQHGLPLTAASAVMVINGLLSSNEVELHAPGPNGLPGGYPVRVSKGRANLSLPPGVSRADAIAINQRCQHQDGIHSINADGSVTFELEQMEMMKALLGFSMPHMQLQDVHQWSVELSHKFKSYANHARRAVGQ